MPLDLIEREAVLRVVRDEVAPWCRIWGTWGAARATADLVQSVLGEVEAALRALPAVDHPSCDNCELSDVCKKGQLAGCSMWRLQEVRHA